MNGVFKTSFIGLMISRIRLASSPIANSGRMTPFVSVMCGALPCYVPLNTSAILIFGWRL